MSHVQHDGLYKTSQHACKGVRQWQVLSQKHNTEAFSETKAATLELMMYSTFRIAFVKA